MRRREPLSIMSMIGNIVACTSMAALETLINTNISSERRKPPSRRTMRGRSPGASLAHLGSGVSFCLSKKKELLDAAAKDGEFQRRGFPFSQRS